MKMNFAKRWNGLIVPLICPILLLCILLRTDVFSSKFEHPNKTIPSSTAEKTVGNLIQRLPKDKKYSLCNGNFLLKQDSNFKRWAPGFYKSTALVSNEFSCQLMQFKMDEAIVCFDHLYSEHELFHTYAGIIKHNTVRSKELKFLFIGDSRSRQHFNNFLKLIPDYDRRFEPSPIPPYCNNIDVISGILRVRVSFRWRPLLNEDVTKMLQKLGDEKESEWPSVIFLSIEIWHMLDMVDAGYHLYLKRLLEIFQILGHLAKSSKVIWLNQYPTLDFYGATGAHNTDIFSEKIHHYNTAVRRILRNQTNILIWDSANPLIEEYIRSCGNFKRSQYGPHEILDPAASFVNCKDYVHPGYSALSRATQLLYNDICNERFFHY